MQVSAVVLARIVAFFDLVELDPRGHAHYPQVFAGIAQQFNFQKFPQKFEDFDTEKGIEFAQGKYDHVTIDKLMIFGGGLSVDTRSSTDDSEKALHEILSWAASKYQIKYRPQMITRKGYVNQVFFRTDIPILGLLCAPVNKLSQRLSDAVGKVLGEKIHYEPTSLVINFDLTTRKLNPAAFTIQRRNDIPFSENKFFSEAPLPTELHLTLLQEFETDLLNSQATKK